MAKDLEVAIVFADVVGSTQLYDKFGDAKASETVQNITGVEAVSWTAKVEGGKIVMYHTTMKVALTVN